MSEDKILDTARLWEELSKLAKFEDTAYDDDLKRAIAKSLNLDPERIAEGLDEKKIPAGSLLKAVLDAMKPFSMMIGELLETYEAAGAVSNNHNIEIHFDFKEGLKTYSLDAFRKAGQEIRVRIRNQLGEKRELTGPGRLIYALNEYKKRAQIEEKSNCPIEIQKWIFEYKEDRLPEHLPDFPNTCYGPLDQKLSELLDFVKEGYQRYRSEYKESVGWKESVRQAAEKYQTDFWRDELSCWLDKFVEDFYDLIEDFRRVESPAGFINEINKILNDEGIISRVTEQTQFSALKDILSMPFWKYRYELYSVWVFTCITDAVSDLGITYNVVDGVLKFEFTGSMLAAFALPDAKYDICSEIRFSAEKLEGEGRKHHIQPDYTIFRKAGDSKSPCALIECKQYKKSSTRNFAAAVNDYAGNIPEAKVFLVNYGPVSKNLSMRIHKDIRMRYEGYGTMRPKTEERDKFTEDLRRYIQGLWAYDQRQYGREYLLWKNRPKEIKVELLWNGSPKDLDLQACIRKPSGQEDYCLSFRDKGSSEEFPYACFYEDMREGPAKETILIKKLLSGCYDISVRNCSREENIDGEIRVKISTGNQSAVISKTGMWDKRYIWHVGIINAFGFVKTDEWGN